jgi:hypothetical protein
MNNTSIMMQGTRAIGDFLIGAVYDTLNATAESIGAIPEQSYNAAKYTFGVDRFVGEGRSWGKIGTGYHGDFWSGDNGLTRFAERVNHTVFSVVLGGVNTVSGGLTYNWVNIGLGVDCPYFFPGPQDARELGQFFSSSLAMVFMGRQLLKAPMRTASSSRLPENLPKSPAAIPVAIEDVAANIRQGNVVAPSILRRMLDIRSPELIDPIARTTVQLLSEGHLPVRLFETIIWDSHPRTMYLVRYLYDFRAGSPRLQAIWRHLGLDAYQMEILPNGDSQLRPMLTMIRSNEPLGSVPSQKQAGPHLVSN